MWVLKGGDNTKTPTPSDAERQKKIERVTEMDKKKERISINQIHLNTGPLPVWFSNGKNM